MAIKSVQAIVNGVTTTLTYDSASKTYKATLTAPAKSSYNQSGHYYGVQIIAKDEAGNTTTVNQSDATLGSKLRLTVKEKTAPVITISSPTASQLLTSNQPTISFTVTDDDSGVNPDTIKLLIGSWDDPYIVFLYPLMDRYGPGGGCIKHNRQRNRSSVGGLPWDKYDYEHL